MSRQELADAVNAHVFAQTRRTCAVDARYIGKLERGERRWPYVHTRAALRAVLGGRTDAELGLFIIHGHANDDSSPLAPAAPLMDAGREPAGPTRLRALLVERQWQTYREFQGQFLRCVRVLAEREDDPLVGSLDVSERQFGRWLHGARPRPDACRVLESLFGEPIAQLLGPADGPSVGPRLPAVPVAEAGSVIIAPDGSAAVQVNVGAGAAVTVVCDDSAPGRIAVFSGAVRVLIDASGVDPATIGVDARMVSGGARVYSLAARRADAGGSR